MSLGPTTESLGRYNWDFQFFVPVWPSKITGTCRCYRVDIVWLHI